MKDVFVVEAVRTAVGTFGGALKDISPSELGSIVVRELLARSAIDPEAIGHVVFGQVMHTEPKDAYLARVCAVTGGVPTKVPAMTVNRLCGSGLQAVVSAAQALILGDADVAIAGGAESMSRAPFLAPSVRWGNKMGDAPLIDMLQGALTDPFHRILMGLTAENIAERYGINRDIQDAAALESHRRAEAAIRAGYFRDQIVSVTVKGRGKDIQFKVDEHIRADAKLEDFTKLRPVFKQDGSVTAGNASGINDGAAAILLASEAAVRTHGLRPLARLVSYGHAGVDPAYMGIGPVPATRNALQSAGLSVQDLDVIESNEAFAAQACAVANELGFDASKVNPNGSGISIGHPVGATGAINVTKIVHEMRRTGVKRGLVTMCIGGGQGIAAIFEMA